MASLRRQGIADKAAVAQLVSADVCTSSQAQPPAHQELNGKAAPGASRRRTRKKRDSGATRASMDAAGDSTDTSEDTGAADTSRPKLRRKKKTRTKKKTKKSSVECLTLTVGNSVAPVQTVVAAKVNNAVANDAEELSFEEEILQNGDITAADHPSSSFINVCIALPEVDRLSCEPDGSSSRPEAEEIDHSVCSTVGSGRDCSRSPVAHPSPLPPSTTASTSMYGQQSAFLSDVHGSLPLLSRAFDDDRRLVAASDRSSNSVYRLPKSVSLQGHQHFLSVDDGLTSRRHHGHRRRLIPPNYRPLTGQRHTLSRLDVEYINRSQIFEMISGQWHQFMSTAGIFQNAALFYVSFRFM